MKMSWVRRMHESGSSDKRQSRASTGAPRRRPTSYHPRSTASATTARRAGTAGRGTPTCSATTRIGRMIAPYRASSSRPSAGLTIAMSGAGSLFRQNGRTAHVGVDPSRQRLHELHEIGALLRDEPERLHIRREPRVLHAAPIVVRNHVVERRLAAVVHVRPTLGHVAQGRRLERAPVRLVSGDGEPPLI